MSQSQSALARHSRIMVLFSLFAAILLIVACDRAGENGSGRSRSSEVRTDTVIVRDTVVVVDTTIVEKEIVKRVRSVDTLLVEKEVVRKIEVPAKVPEHYVRAWEIQIAKLSAAFADEKMCFSGLSSLAVDVDINEPAKEILSKQRVKDKFELTLRRHGVPLTDFSNPYLIVDVDALWNDFNTIVTFHFQVTLAESLIFYRNDMPFQRVAGLWETGVFGRVGKDLARESFLNEIEEKAERVANLYLSAN